MAVPSRDVAYAQVSIMLQQVPKKHSLDLPTKNNIEPVDNILYNLVERVTFVVVSPVIPARDSTSYPYAAAHWRTAGRHGGQTKDHLDVSTVGSR